MQPQLIIACLYVLLTGYCGLRETHATRLWKISIEDYDDPIDYFVNKQSRGAVFQRLPVGTQLAA